MDGRRRILFRTVELIANRVVNARLKCSMLVFSLNVFKAQDKLRHSYASAKNWMMRTVGTPRGSLHASLSVFASYIAGVYGHTIVTSVR